MSVLLRSRLMFPLTLILILGILGYFWWSLRTQRLNPAPTITTGEKEKTVQLGFVDFQVAEGEVDAQSANMPDYQPLPRDCQPLQSFFSYTSAAEDQSVAAFAWDNATVTSDSSSKLQRLQRLPKVLDDIYAQADGDHHLAISTAFDHAALFPWRDSACDITSDGFFSPILIEKPELEGYDQAWYLESIEDDVTLPVGRWLFLNRGTTWIVLHHEHSSQSELDLAFETLHARLQSKCQVETADPSRSVPCLSQEWFATYRKPAAAKAWIAKQISRISFSQ